MSSIQNRKAKWAYELQAPIEAGVQLFGPEVKAIRAGKASLVGAWVDLINNEAFLKGCLIQDQPDTLRPKKLLLHRQELLRLQKAIDQKGVSCIPLEIYISGGKIKVQIALGKGKTQGDKREAIKKRDLRRDND